MTIVDNEASEIGGGMWVVEGASVDFARPFRVNISDNTARTPVRSSRTNRGSRLSGAETSPAKKNEPRKNIYQ